MWEILRNVCVYIQIVRKNIILALEGWRKYPLWCSLRFGIIPISRLYVTLIRIVFKSLKIQSIGLFKFDFTSVKTKPTFLRKSIEVNTVFIYLDERQWVCDAYLMKRYYSRRKYITSWSMGEEYGASCCLRIYCVRAIPSFCEYFWQSAWQQIPTWLVIYCPLHILQHNVHLREGYVFLIGCREVAWQ